LIDFPSGFTNLFFRIEYIPMSGHSKWSQIKHKKGISDQKRGQLFSKLAKKISIAARDGSDPSSNFKLQASIDEARSFNMPKDNIERAIKRASEKEITDLENIIIQAMGPSGVAFIIEAITDNRNRTINEIKNILAKNETKMVPEDSLNWMFDKDWTPYSPIELADQNFHNKIEKLFNELDEQDDVENIHSNANLGD
jgi:transcriptional/translational regulatory protein YebC/TACO1